MYKNCRHQLKRRKRPIGKHMPIKDRTSIEGRPPEADGTRLGDWEMDLIVGADNKGAMVTLVERGHGVHHDVIGKCARYEDIFCASLLLMGKRAH